MVTVYQKWKEDPRQAKKQENEAEHAEGWKVEKNQAQEHDTPNGKWQKDKLSRRGSIKYATAARNTSRSESQRTKQER